MLLSHPKTSLPLARLQSLARQHPDRLAATIIAALKRRNWGLDDLKGALQIDTLQVLRLSMSRSLEQHDMECGIAAIASALPCDRAVLREILVNEGKS